MVLSLRPESQGFPSGGPCSLIWSVLFDDYSSTLCSVQPFTGIVDPKANSRFEGVRELRAGLPRGGKFSRQDSITVGP